MSRSALTCTVAVVGAFALPAGASAEIIEIGKIDTPPTPVCPKSCQALSRTTGYQAKVGEARALMAVPKDGRIVAWSVSLGKPGPKQTAFFNDKLGGESVAQITVLEPRGNLRYRAVGQGAAIALTPYFGTVPQFALGRSIPVKKGQIIALTVRTWAPVLAVGLGADTSWRASRGRGGCEETGTQTAQLAPNQLAQYYCLYRTARLPYSATLVTTPAANTTSTTAGKNR